MNIWHTSHHVSSSDSLYKKFEKTADKLRESVIFSYVFTESADGDVSSVHCLSGVKAPAVDSIFQLDLYLYHVL